MVIFKNLLAKFEKILYTRVKMNMGRIEEMLLRSGLIYTAPDGTRSRIEGSVLGGSMVIRNADGWVTHRIERATFGDDLVVRNVATGLVEQRFAL